MEWRHGEDWVGGGLKRKSFSSQFKCGQFGESQLETERNEARIPTNDRIGSFVREG